MTTTTDQIAEAPVRKTITVRASVARAFDVFTREYRHLVATEPSHWQRADEEGDHRRAGGRPLLRGANRWHRVRLGHGSRLDPPHRVVLAWQIDGSWKYQADLAKSSEVEVRFTQESDGTTRVDLEHRHLSRHGTDAGAVRTAVDSPNGWTGLLQLFAARVEQTNSAAATARQAS